GADARAGAPPIRYLSLTVQKAYRAERVRIPTGMNFAAPPERVWPLKERLLQPIFLRAGTGGAGGEVISLARTQPVRRTRKEETALAPPSRYVADPKGLAELVQTLRPLLDADPRLAVDTEFIRERTYAPVLEIVQVAASAPDGVHIALIDVPAVGGDL